jgi:hypothetical protein
MLKVISTRDSIAAAVRTGVPTNSNRFFIAASFLEEDNGQVPCTHDSAEPGVPQLRGGGEEAIVATLARV